MTTWSKRRKHHNKMAVGEDSSAKGVEQLIKTATALGNTTIDLGRKNLTEIPSEIVELPQLEVNDLYFRDILGLKFRCCR